MWSAGYRTLGDALVVVGMSELTSWANRTENWMEKERVAQSVITGKDEKERQSSRKVRWSYRKV